MAAPLASKRVLIVATSCDKLGDTNDKTGLWCARARAHSASWVAAGNGGHPTAYRVARHWCLATLEFAHTPC